MANLGLTVQDGTIFCDGCPDLDYRAALTSILQKIPEDAPIAILIHGYKYDPAAPNRNPHQHIFSASPKAHKRVRSWPKGLGFSSDTTQDGLCIGFAWSAYNPSINTLISHRKNSFLHSYDQAAYVATILAQLLVDIEQIAPNRKIDLVSHSLGARVTLLGIDQANSSNIGKVILMGAAEYKSVAQSSAMNSDAEFYNLTSRENDIFDFLFETFAKSSNKNDRALGNGLDQALSNWVDIQIDRKEVIQYFISRGIVITDQPKRLCHWSFYTRSGMMDLYHNILRQRVAWSVPVLRSDMLNLAQQPRWSSLFRNTYKNQGDISFHDRGNSISSNSL